MGGGIHRRIFVLLNKADDFNAIDYVLPVFESSIAHIWRCAFQPIKKFPRFADFLVIWVLFKHDVGWVVLELEGDAEEIGRSLEWAREVGVRVDAATLGDVVEGS